MRSPATAGDRACSRGDGIVKAVLEVSQGP